jgi:hypothetical protein
MARIARQPCGSTFWTNRAVTETLDTSLVTELDGPCRDD